MLKKIIKKAYFNPHLRSELLPIIKLAMEFPTEEALKQYLKDHPSADPKNHSVSKSQGMKPSMKESKEGVHLSLGNIEPKELTKALDKALSDKLSSVKETLSTGSNIEPDVLKSTSKKTLDALSKEPFGKSVSPEMKTAVQAYKKDQTIDMITKGYSIFRGVMFGVSVAAGAGVAVPAITGAIGIGMTYGIGKMCKSIINKNAKKRGEEENLNYSKLSHDILRNKVTPSEINKKYESQVNDITKKIKSGKLNPVDALKSLDEIESKYKKDALPHIEKSLKELGFKKNKDGEYGDDYADSLSKMAASEEDNVVLAIVIDNLRHQLDVNLAMQEMLDNKEDFTSELQKILTGETPIPKAEFEEINQISRKMK